MSKGDFANKKLVVVIDKYTAEGALKLGPFSDAQWLVFVESNRINLRETIFDLVSHYPADEMWDALV